MITNAWAVVDAKFATDAAARQAVRTFVESDDPDRALSDATAAARAAIAGHGRDPGRTQVSAVGPAMLARCARVTVEVTYFVPALSLPFIGGYGSSPFEVTSRRSELVDPFRSGLEGQAEDCG